MESPRWRLLILFVLFSGMASHAHVQAASMPPSTLLDDGAARDAVDAVRVQAYHDALAQYEIALQADPANAHLAVSRCRFIDRFTDDEYGDWIDSATQDHGTCLDALRAKWAEHPAAMLYLYEQDWSEESLARGEALLSAAAGWPDDARVQLLAGLSRRYAINRKAGKSMGSRLVLCIRHA